MKRVLLAVCAFIILPLAAAAAEVTLNPIADAPIWSGAPNTNNGSAIDGYWGYYNGAQRTLVKWNVSGIYGTVTACRLRFQVTTNNWVATNMIMACRVTGSWVENTVTYNTQPGHDSSLSTGVFFEILPPTAPGTFTYNCETLANTIVQNWIANPSANNGLLLRMAWEGGNEAGRAFPYMREAYPAYTPVQLIVTYTAGGSGIAPASLGRVKALLQ